jgi:cytidyltransferase-like protein
MIASPAKVYVSDSFDDLRFKDYRFLEQAAKLGPVHAFLWSDETVQAVTGKAPKFPDAEREYSLQAVRYISSRELVTGRIDPDCLPTAAVPGIWAVPETADTPAKRNWAQRAGFEYRVFADSVLATPPAVPTPPDNPQTGRKKVVVTGCFDWFHSGHIRFFEEVSELGDLYVVVGNDANLCLLKGPGHPLFPGVERRYIASSIRYVKEALISSGMGWMDAEPEFVRIKPDMYAVNEDGDKPEKAEFCKKYGITYRVLKRLPKEGLPRRQSTALRGF